jgi:hypothetical protein
MHTLHAPAFEGALAEVVFPVDAGATLQGFNIFECPRPLFLIYGLNFLQRGRRLVHIADSPRIFEFQPYADCFFGIGSLERLFLKSVNRKMSALRRDD